MAVVRAPRRGLVLGAGAALGGAWTLGALSALADVEGFDAAAADIIVGTSAGSVLGAMIASRVPLAEMVQHLSGAGGDLAGTAPVNPMDVAEDHVHRALGGIPRPKPVPASPRLAIRTLTHPHRHTLMTLAAAFAPQGRGDLAPVRELIRTVDLDGGWPNRPATWIVAMETPAGRRVVFGRAGSPVVPLADAVVASCSAPGYFPPVALGGRWYVDGGAVSMTNADVLAAEALDEVLVLAPMGMRERDGVRTVAGRLERRLRRYANRRLAVEVRQLVDRGMSVRVIAPGADDLRAIGANVMNPDRRDAVFHTALASTRALLLRHRDTPSRPNIDTRSA